MERAVAEAVAILGRTPDVLRALLNDVPEPWLERTEGEGTFAPRDVVGHLIHGERTDWVPRLRHILEFGVSGHPQPITPAGWGVRRVTDPPPSHPARLELSYTG